MQGPARDLLAAKGRCMAESTDVIQGTIDMLVLKSLSLEPMHGFGVDRRIEQISRGVFRVNPGSRCSSFAGWSAPGSSMRNGGRARTTGGPGTIRSQPGVAGG